jgi:hypothetical protein
MRLTYLPVILIFSSIIAVGQQTAVETTVTVVPPKPSCTLLFRTGSCSDLWRNYNQAVATRRQEEIQLYVNRQKELASQAATAPLQQQISGLTRLTTDQQTQIGKLHQQMQADQSAGVESIQTSHQQGLLEGIGVGGAAALILMAITLAISGFSPKFTITSKSTA